MGDYGNCTFGCIIRYTTDNGSTWKTRSARYRKKGHAVACEKCGYSVNRANLLVERLRTKEKGGKNV